MSALASWWMTFAVVGWIVLGLSAVLERALCRAACSTRELVLRAGLCAAAFAPALAPMVATRLPTHVTSAWDVTSHVVAWWEQPAAPIASSAKTTAHEGDATQPSPSTSPFAAPTLLAVWAGVACLMLLRTAASLVVAHRTGRGFPRLDDADWYADLDALRARIGVRRTIRLRIRDDETPAHVLGGPRPILVLPRSARGWTPAHRCAVLAHELAHVERGDPLWVPLLRCAVALRWFDPLAWWIERRANALREHACDDRAITLGTRPSSLASALWAAFAAARPTTTPAVIPGIAPAATLAARIHLCLERDRPRGRPRAFVRMGTSIAMFAACVALASRAPASSVALRGDALPSAQTRWTDGSIVVGAFLNGTVSGPSEDDASVRLSPGGRLVIFAVEPASGAPRTWIGSADSAGVARWRAFVGERETAPPHRSDSTWAMVLDETLRRLCGVQGSGAPIAKVSTRTSGSTLVGSTACTIDPGAAVVLRRFETAHARCGVFAQREAWAAFVADGDDGSAWVGIRGLDGALHTLDGEARDPTALAVRCMDAAADAFSSMR
jgi:beta-lactamase regulating signal transducer with metallopeptidase domain